MLGDIAPNGSAAANLSVAIQRRFSGKNVPIRATVRESSPFRVRHTEDVSLVVDATAPRQVIALDRNVRLIEDSDLLSGASSSARSVARLEAPAVLRAVAELGDYVKVGIPGADASGEFGWLVKSNIDYAVDSNSRVSTDQASAPMPLVIREIVNQPPSIFVLSPRAGRDIETGESHAEILAELRDDVGIRDWELTVNGRRIDGGARGIRVSNGASSASSISIDERVPLGPGPNKFRLSVVDSNGFGVGLHVRRSDASATNIQCCCARRRNRRLRRSGD